MTTNPNYIPPRGAFAVTAYQFRDHVDGYAFRHNSDQIDVNPSVVINGTPEITVAAALSAISSYITQDLLNGQGFISIGDGYDTYHNSDTTPLTPYDSSTPSIDAALNDLLNNSSNPQYHRIRSGGIVLIKAGTYKITNTVNVPPGIILLGEGFGTKIINQTSTKAPLFNIKADLLRSSHDALGDTNKFMFSKDTIFMNLIIADNFIEPRFLGDTLIKNPQNTDGYSLVTMEEGSSFVCDNVKFIGKVTIPSSTPTLSSGYAISTNSTIPSSTGTSLNIRNSIFDAFANPISFTSSGNINDYFYCLNNKIRSYGSSNNGYGITGIACPINLRPCNSNINNNYIVLQYINNNLSGAVPTVVYTPGALPSLTVQKLNCSIVNNNIFATDNTVSIPATLNILTISANPSQSTMDATFNYIISGNNDFNGGFSIAFNPSGGNSANGATAGYFQTSTKAVLNDNTLFLNGQTIFGPYALATTVLSGTYTIAPTDIVLYPSTFSSPVTINLPTASNPNLPRTIIIKDTDGKASINPITLVRNSGGETIEGLGSDYIMSTNFQSIRLHTFGDLQWFIIG